MNFNAYLLGKIRKYHHLSSAELAQRVVNVNMEVE